MDLFILFLIVCFVFWLFDRNKKNSLIRNVVLPKQLGHRKEIPLAEKVLALDEALNSHFEERIKQRYMAEHKNTSEAQYNLLFFELERFLVMCSLLKNVPMFSDKVDNIWHEMLMFTREYEDFSKSFYGQFLHHTPVEAKVPEPDNRAFYDLIYSELFEFTPYTPLAWGAFFKNPLNRNQIEEILSCSVSELKQKYFREDADDKIIGALIEQLKARVTASLEKKSFKIQSAHYKNIKEYSPLLAEAMIFYSMYHAEQYTKFMIPVQASSTSNCSSSGCSSSGCSSSSCGSSCGGGCGGS